jgi:NDP-sugar pyrophosphorylase family protein
MREKKNSHSYFNVGYPISGIFSKFNLKKFENSSLLKDEEVKILENNGCWADDWKQIHVKRPFDPSLIHGTGFYGTVYIGRLEKGFIQFHGVSHPIGIFGCQITSSCIDDYSSISRSTVSEALIGRNVIIHNCSELSTDPDGFKKPVIIGAGNEKAGREALLFNGITMEEIWMQTHLKSNDILQQFLAQFNKAKLAAVTPYTVIEDNCVIENAKAVRSIKLGRRGIISGAARVEECVIASGSASRTAIGDNAIVKQSFIGGGVNIESGAFVEQCFLDRQVTIKQLARVIQSAVGSNSTIACGEVQNCFIGPLHEQHHNSSFLIAADIGGQCNIASGANLGSNHNSRSNDGELVAGRGFWAGLSTSVKYCSSFAPFTLLAKSSFAHELNIELPFSLVSDNVKDNTLDVMPAYWWRHNMYALFRNNWKFQKRLGKGGEGIEYQFMAPDTAEEVQKALDLLKEYKKKIPAFTMENSSRKVQILGIDDGIKAYKEMLLWYGVSTVLAWLERPGVRAGKYNDIPVDASRKTWGWTNVCGHLVCNVDLKQMVQEIEKGDFISWDDVEERFERFDLEYPKTRFAHALHVLALLYGKKQFDQEMLEKIKTDYKKLSDKIKKQIVATRTKDFENKFRKNVLKEDDSLVEILSTI